MNTIDTSYYSLFGIAPDTAGRILRAALSKGGDYADIFCEHTVTNELSLRDGEVNAVRSNIDFGAGIRVLSGDRTGYAFSESMSKEALLKAAATAAEIARESKPGTELPADCTPVDFTNRYPVISDWEQHSVEERKYYLTMLRDLIHQKSDKVINITARINDSETRILFYNSLGQTYTDLRPMASMSAVIVMKDGDRLENFYSSKSYRKGFEFLSDTLVEELASDVVKGCSRLFEAGRPSCGEMPVVMGAGSLRPTSTARAYPSSLTGWDRSSATARSTLWTTAPCPRSEALSTWMTRACPVRKHTWSRTECSTPTFTTASVPGITA